MELKHFFYKILSIIRPSEHQLMVKKWYNDGGEDKMRFNYHLNEKSLVLDVGGYNGQWSSDIFSRYKCKIFIFEPVRFFAENITMRFEKNDSICVCPFGLGGYTRTEKIFISADGSSIFEKSPNYEEINIVDIYEWININGIEKVDLIKINIEGGEYELMNRLIQKKMVTKFKNIQIQFHNIFLDSSEKMISIQKELNNTHKLTYQYEFVWENWEVRVK